jgi:hypothetical protein
MRLLILSCSATKRTKPGLLLALHRYDGPSYRVLRKALRELAQDACPKVAILSAEFGLITGDTPIPWYDRRMDATRAAALAPLVQRELQALLAEPPTDVFVHLGRDYLPTLGTVPPGSWRICYARGGIGERLGQLRRWLYDPQQREVSHA